METTQSVVIGVGVAGLILLPFVTYYIIALVIQQLAKRNLFWTFVAEGRAKTVIRNGRFAFCVMSYSGHTFRQDTLEPPTVQEEKWEVVKFDPTKAQSRRYLPMLKNIRWIGLPPFSDVPLYRFSWTSLEEVQGDKSSLSKMFNYKEEDIDYILVQDDVYVTRIETAECADNIPLNLVVLVGGRVVNVYKARFRVERWLEATLNVIGIRMRDFVAERTYAEIRQISQTKEEGVKDITSKLMDNFFKKVREDIEKSWGFRTKFIRIYSVDPGSNLAEDFILASTRLYVAQQKAAADTAEGEGLAARDAAHFAAISKITGGVEMYRWLRIGESNLTTLVERGGGAIPAIPLGGEGQPLPPLSPPSTEPEEEKV